MANRANRYSLNIIDIEGNESIIPITYNGKTYKKMPLTIIDMMTTNYDQYEFQRILSSLGYYYGYVFIDYQANGERKILDVAYSENTTIKNESNYRETQITKGNPEPKSGKNVVLLSYSLMDIQRHNKKLWSYLQNTRCIWREFAMAIATYNHLVDENANENDILYWQFEIMKYIGEYSTFRKITIAINEYMQKKEHYNENVFTQTMKQKLYEKRRK